MADAQTLLWQHLKDAPQGLSFVRDHDAEGFTLPFYCEDAHLAVEHDRLGADQRREFPGRAPAGEIHLKEAVLGV